jgi:hypothetical protein
MRRPRPLAIEAGEAAVVGSAAAALGYAFGLGVSDLVDGDAWVPASLAAVAAVNGLFAGARGVYAWATPGGVLAFVLDCSWALVSTFLGVIVNAINTAQRDAGYAPEFSIRQNRHVFASGFALKRGFANTQGPVISNAGLGRDEPLSARTDLIERHEGLHVWQQRWFGPLHPTIYVVWGVVAGLIAFVFALVSRERRRRGASIGKLVETAAYYDNPFEYWAYRNDGRWEANSAHPALKWGAFRWPDQESDQAQT